MKITDEIVEEIYIELREGKSSKWIANQFGISRQSIQLINNGKNHRQKDMQYPIRSVEKTPETYIVDGIEHIKTGAYINFRYGATPSTALQFLQQRKRDLTVMTSRSSQQ